MGLDARVYCDCIRRGHIRIPHPFPELLFLDEDGCPNIRSDDLERQIMHDTWQWKDACTHQNCTAIHHRIGNISHISHIKRAIQELQLLTQFEYTIVLQKILSSGSHAGDHITIDLLTSLEQEIRKLRTDTHLIHDSDIRNALAYFTDQVQELARASWETGNPIIF